MDTSVEKGVVPAASVWTVSGSTLSAHDDEVVHDSGRRSPCSGGVDRFRFFFEQYHSSLKRRLVPAFSLFLLETKFQ